MADSKSSVQSSPSLVDLIATLDPYTLSTTTPVKPITTPRSNSTPAAISFSDFSFERGPRYELYSKLRESRIRSRNSPKERESQIPRLIPSSPIQARKSLALDFSSSSSRKENRRPNVMMMSPARDVSERCFSTPPRDLPKPSRVLSNGSKLGGGGSRSVGVMGRKSCASYGDLMGFSASVARGCGGGGGGGSQSVGVLGEKKGAMMGRKSYASMEDLRGLSAAAANAISGETKGMIQTRKSYASMNDLKRVSSTAGGAIAGESRGGKIGNMIDRLRSAATGGKRAGGEMAGRNSYASFEEIKGLSAVERGVGGGFGVARGSRTPGRDGGFGYRHW